MTDATEPRDGKVRKLLTLGETRLGAKDRLPDYAAMGFEPADIPALIQLATDETLLDANAAKDEAWGPVHAWRVLGHLRAAEAVEPLVRLFARFETSGDEYVVDDLPRALALVGAPALPILVEYAASGDHDKYARGAAAEALTHTAAHWPNLRDEIAGVLTRLLENHRDQDEYLNSILVDGIVKLRVAEALPLVEEAYAADSVDEMFIGDWEDVQIAFGLLSERRTPRRFHWETPRRPHAPPPRPGKVAAARKNAKRNKAARKARKKNRKR